MDNLNSVNIFEIILKKAKTLAIIVFAAAVISFAFSFLLKEKYKSTAVIYPVNMYHNSEESNSEQLLQYLMSEDVKNDLAREFKLYEKYGIDTLHKKGGRALFSYVYNENFAISPTLYESIEISVKDEDPAMAQKLNERLITLTNELIKKNKLHVIHQYLGNSGRVLETTSNELDSLDHKVRKIRMDYNILDSKQQMKYLTKAAMKGKMTDDEKKQLDAIKQKGEELKILGGKINSALHTYTEIKVIHDKYLLDSEATIDFILYVSKPNFPDKRCYPVRWIIVMVSSMSALLLGIVIIIIRSRTKTS